MSEENPISLVISFQDLPDPRVAGRCDRKLIDILVITVCAVLAGAARWVDVERFGQAKHEWLKTFLKLPHGIPSHDTFGRFFAVLDAEAFQTAFMPWVEGVFRVRRGQVMAIDGKTVRRSHNRTIGKDAIHMVNAWTTRSGIALGQGKTDAKSNEITAIPPLLRQLNVAGCIVTVDAMGAQTRFAQAIRDEKADYRLRVKDNQGHLHQDIQDWFAHADHVQFADLQHSSAETVNKGHGRIEIRRCWAISDPLAFEYIRNDEGWTDLQTMVRVQRERRLPNKSAIDTAYYISSLPAEAEPLPDATRFHWAVENSLHWVLDVIFREDDTRVRVGHAAHNMAILRQLALNIIKRDSSKGSIRTKRFRPGLISPSLKSYSIKFDAIALALA
ncbi:ISAs1 family transposase [Aggregatilinea lenta]|uniref:ISAs1 family transposase n=1 Tax=Aggregatilinea lenta TaxID=913108 RepID=UPI000E5A1187|nr:ISAs1 family transposase [Aggregatilinea lenta]